MRLFFRTGVSALALRAQHDTPEVELMGANLSHDHAHLDVLFHEKGYEAPPLDHRPLLQVAAAARNVERGRLLPVSL